jgi:Domain of unknown function (DUF4214)
MFSNLSEHFKRVFSANQNSSSVLSAKPAIEALEDRSLLDASAYVSSLYTNLLQRSPTATELNGWVSQINNGESLQAVSSAIINGSERLGVIVNADYTTLLGRSADQSGFNFWVQQMQNGMTQDQVEANILSSQEYAMVHGSTDQDFINGIYESVLHRSPSAAEFNYWNNQLIFKTYGDTSRQDVASLIVGSDEAHLRAVDALYSQLLHRNADPSGESHWASVLDGGGTESKVAAGLVDSTEYLNATGVAGL